MRLLLSECHIANCTNASNYRVQEQSQHRASVNVYAGGVYLKTERARVLQTIRRAILATWGRCREDRSVQLREMRGPVPAYPAVYLFADGPDEPPCISRVDSSPGTLRDSPSDRPARPVPDIGNRRMFERRISFSTAYRK